MIHAGFSLLAKRALLICWALPSRKLQTMAFAQQASQECEAKSMPVPAGCGEAAGDLGK
jgi:hypothetical protein